MRGSHAIAACSTLITLAALTACLTTSGLSDGTPPNAADSGTDATQTTQDASTILDGAAIDAGADSGRDFSTDPSKFFGDSRCATAGVQLCEDFESGTLDTSTWSYVGGTHPTIDGAEHARGSKALHILIHGNGASMIKETKTFPESGDIYWGRIFVYFHQLPHEMPADGGMPYAHWTFAYGASASSPQIRLSAQLQKKGANYINLFGVGTDDGAPIPSDAGTGDWTLSDDDPAGSPSPVPTDAWQCIEWLHDGTNEVTRFFWNATEHPSLMTTATEHGGNPVDYDMPAFSEVVIGWQEYQPSVQTFEMWVDEIAIDSNRIGCVL